MLNESNFAANVTPELVRAYQLIARHQVQSVDLTITGKEGLTDSHSNGVNHHQNVFYTVTGETIPENVDNGEQFAQYMLDDSDLYHAYYAAFVEVQGDYYKDEEGDEEN